MIVMFNGLGSFDIQSLSSVSDCPDSHFLCRDHLCLPVYLICNGVNDCLEGEDELDCDSYTCPGYYRCWKSQVCLHLDHVCDGIYQCPQQDDEMLCDLKCPDGCHCQGLAFICMYVNDSSYMINHSTHHKSQHESLLLKVRYFDGSNSNIQLYTLHGLPLLVHVKFVSNSLTNIIPLDLPNVKILDLSFNHIETLSLSNISTCQQLQRLNLMGNPLTQLSQTHTSLPSIMSALVTLDLSYTDLTHIPRDFLSIFQGLKVLNLTASKLKEISKEIFQNVTRLEVLDIQQVILFDFSDAVLTSVSSLKYVFTDDYRLCCKSLLPRGFNLVNCHFPSDLVASCDRLIKEKSFTISLWIMLVTSSVSIPLLIFIKKTLKTHHRCFMDNIFYSTMVMGVYVAMILTADEVFKGQFFLHDQSWRQSAGCKFAMFLWILSFTSSSLSLVLILLVSL